MPVYARQLFPERVLGAGGVGPARAGETLYENDGVRLWCLPAVDAGIGIADLAAQRAERAELLVQRQRAVAIQHQAAPMQAHGLEIHHAAIVAPRGQQGFRAAAKGRAARCADQLQQRHLTAERAIGVLRQHDGVGLQ